MPRAHETLLADAGRYPPIDVLTSRSRVMASVVSPRHNASARMLREMLDKYARVETLIQIGEYRAGSDPLADRAIATHEAIRRFLYQDAHETSPLQGTISELCRLAGD